MKPKFITLINDCKDDNAKSRQTTRWSALFPSINVSFVGVDSSLGKNSTIEAAGNIIDILDASMHEPGILAVNVAPRGTKTDGENGSSFCYFWIGNVLVVSTVKDYNLSLVKKFGMVKNINILDIPTILKKLVKAQLVSRQLAEHISKSQFRSFDFQPRVAKWICDGVDVPSKKIPIKTISDIPQSAWCIDSFGNIKLTLTAQDFCSSTPPCIIKTSIGVFKYYKHLKDVPDGDTAIYIGSSGWKKHRFLELATQNRKPGAAKKLGVKIGSEINIL
ncbi:hypothetical protein IPM62_00185 [Candidatus Woesebacteria bacterium]|nr:MAG: hypothetical protein IPM62_00185 [Candidatus Woesebacteria bacterium]